MSPVTYLTVSGQTRQTTWPEVHAAAQRVKEFCDALNARFPGRQELVEKIKYALLSRHHVLLVGIHGTAKTLLFNAVLKSMKGTKVWSTQMTSFTKPTDVFGPVNIPLMRETGFQDLLTEGMLPDANFARIGEFFDANEHMLRSLLGIVHERELQVGRQHIKAPLMTVFADTNFRPEGQAERAHKMAALVDRFLFRVDVDYLETKEDRLAMFDGFIKNDHNTPVGELTMQDLEMVSGVVRSMSLFKDPYVLQAYEEITRLFRDQQKARNVPVVSDRRLAEGMNVLEVRAILRGRDEVTFEDIEAARMYLCGDEEDRAFFRDKVPDLIEAWFKRAMDSAIDAERARVTAVLAPIDGLKWDDMKEKVDIVAKVVQLEAVRTELRALQTQYAVVGREVLAHGQTVTNFIHDGQALLIKFVTDRLPTEEAIRAAPPTEWMVQRELLKAAAQELRGIIPVDDRVQTAQRDAIERCIALNSALVETSKMTEVI